MAAELPLMVDGDTSFALGVDGFTSPNLLGRGEYQDAMNIICRGGMAQTRPGSLSAPFKLPRGNFQGITLFKPNSGVANLVFAINGRVYVSPTPFNTYVQLPNIQFSPYSRFVTWSAGIKSADYDAGGTLTFLATPLAVLVMQDGATRPAYWDGTVSRHLDPSIQETPVGLWMQWSNNRLWVSRGSQIFASDIGNPLKFTEAQYLNEGRAFYLTGPCTGICETSDHTGIVAFTKENGAFIQASLQDRTLWLNTPGFQTLIFTGVGCVAGRSIIQQYGLLWWWTPRGLVNQDNALSINITSRLDVRDSEMIGSKYNISHDLSGVCGSRIENFLFHGIPNGDKVNTRVLVLDQIPFEDQPNSWPSYWTGWRPVEFASGVVDSHERVFCASVDADGENRIWELFRPEKTDDGAPITSFIVSRRHFFFNTGAYGNTSPDRDYKRFKYAEIELENIWADTAVMVAVKGIRGGFQPVMVKDISALHGQVYYSQKYGPNAIAGSRSQSRVVRTVDGYSATECNAGCVESKILGLVDKAFEIMIMWSGVAGVSCYRLFALPEPKAFEGVCELDETGENNLLNDEGCGVKGLFTTKSPFTTYYASAVSTQKNPTTGQIFSVEAFKSSIINQADADRKATALALHQIQEQLGQIV